MLILARKIDESITIGRDIIVTITKIHSNQVHVGIKAPKGIPVHRSEIYEQIQRQSTDEA